MTDPFEARVADALRRAAPPDPDEIESLRAYAASLPRRRRLLLAPVWLAAAGVAVVALPARAARRACRPSAPPATGGGTRRAVTRAWQPV